MNKKRLLLAPSLAATLVLCGCEYQVDTFEDAPDINVGDYICETAAGNCSLRAAVMEAGNSATEDTISVPSGIYNLDLGSLKINNNMKIQGSGKDNTIIDQKVSDTVLKITAGNVEINNVKIQGGSSQAGGGVYIDDGEVNMTDVIIEDNFGFTGGGGIYIKEDAFVIARRLTINNNSAQGAFGGGLWNQGTTFIYDSSITNNDSNRAGGVRNSGNLNLRNVTVSGNKANSAGAGVGGISQNGFLVLYNATVTLNEGVGNNATSFRGGGIQTGSGKTTVMKNSIIANNDGGIGPDDCVGTLSGDSKYNLIGDADGCTIPSYVSTFILDESAELNSLGQNLIGTYDHTLQYDSPALNAGYQFPAPAADGCESRDQRGVPRNQSGNRCDMGSLYGVSTSTHVTGYMLVDASSNTDIKRILHGDVFHLSDFPAGGVSIRAITSGTPTSVVFDFDGVSGVKIENSAPFSIGGDASGDYAAFPLTVAEHTIIATPYTGVNGTGVAGGGIPITFEVLE